MHFDRKVEQCRYDIRCRTYYVYKCNICGHEHDFNNVSHFNTSLLRPCPSCGIIDDTNDREYLIKRMHDLEQEIKALKDRRLSLETELSEVSLKLQSMNEQVTIQ